MCGIAGIFSVDSISENQKDLLKDTMSAMRNRGPDHTGYFSDDHFSVGHNRLSIIDTTSNANQPMISKDGNYVLAFNGEIFNFHELKSELIKQGIHFNTDSDTEVLLYLLMKEGKNALARLNGFFALSFYDKKNNQVLIARDRFGEKPLKYQLKNGQLYFSSETKAVSKLSGEKKLDRDALQLFFQYNYIPAPFTIYQNIHKLMPGECLEIKNGNLQKSFWYDRAGQLPFENTSNLNNELKDILVDSVKLRMIADVPLGCFLSGGIDSTIIAGIGKELNKDLLTFSIGFPDEKHFDETEFAIEAANHLQTKHEVFNVHNKTLLENLDDIIGKMDEPFADSSAIAVYELCKQTKNKITVALSGDGADELFGGYHKHYAHTQSEKKNTANFLLKNSGGITNIFKGSRNSKVGNKLRQINRYKTALKMNPVDRYIHWASVLPVEKRKELFNQVMISKDVSSIMDYYFDSISEGKLNEILATDIKLVLANDMLVKTDLMSMACSLEVRPPFLDHRVVDFSMRVPQKMKINGKNKKFILKETFSHFFTPTLMNRAKKGFEVPLHTWFKTDLKQKVNQSLDISNTTNKELFNSVFLQQLKKDTFSNSPGESSSTVWAMIVFHEWVRKNEIEL